MTPRTRTSPDVETLDLGLDAPIADVATASPPRAYRDEPGSRPPARVPCPDVATFRAHATHHRQLPGGSWTCDACAATEAAPPRRPALVDVDPSDPASFVVTEAEVELRQLRDDWRRAQDPEARP